MKLSIQTLTGQKQIRNNSNYLLDYFKFRVQSEPESKLAIPNFLVAENLKFKEVNKLAEKIKWMSYFQRSYAGNTQELSLINYSPNISRIFVVESEKKQLGFIRIVNRSKYFENFSVGEVWSISEIFVKPPYRGNAIATQLMHYVLKNYPVKLILLETERFYKKKYYFNRVGFVNEIELSNGLSRIYVAGMEEAAKLVHPPCVI